MGSWVFCGKFTADLAEVNSVMLTDAIKHPIHTFLRLHSSHALDTFAFFL